MPKAAQDRCRKQIPQSKLFWPGLFILVCRHGICHGELGLVVALRNAIDIWLSLQVSLS